MKFNLAAICMVSIRYDIIYQLSKEYAATIYNYPVSLSA
jgi:hypothetical protein